MDDTIPVRSDEQLDVPRLLAWLRTQLATPPTDLAVRQFGGGAANLTYALSLDGHEYVLRRPPLGPVAASAHDMAREFRVLSVLHQAFPPAPQATLFCADSTIIGAPFFVMERRHGLVIRRTLPPELDTPAAPGQLGAALVDTLADLHAVDYAALGLADLGHPAGFVARQIAGWYRRWEAAKHVDSPAMERVHAWLLAHQPASVAATLVHNDYKLDNTMFSPDPLRLVAVFDWDMGTLGDPLADLGTLLTYWSQPDDPPLLQQMAMMPIDARFWTREQLVQRYAARSGRDVSHIDFYHALGLFRLAVILAQIYIRFVRGQTADQRFAAFEHLIPVVIAAAEALIARARI